MGSLKIIDAGLFTSIQDAGRTGYRKYGIPYSGAADPKAYEEANRLVGNQAGSPVIEFTLQGGRIRFNSRAVIALTGADMSPVLNGSAVIMYGSFLVKEGDELKLQFAKRGCRTYLAIAGELKADKVFGSYSTFGKAGFGGYKGRNLKAGDELSWTETTKQFSELKTPVEEIPYYSSKLKLKLMKGPEWNWLSEEGGRQFLDQEFKVSSSSDRMGVRLEGTKVKALERQMISSPVIPGIIQLPGNGEPIILMNDGQTIGGYPRIAKVYDSELWRVGQVKPGDTIRFEMKEST